MTYEMIVGFPPFYTGNSNNNKMYELIKSKPVFFPDAKKHGIAMSDQCKDFIRQVCIYIYIWDQVYIRCPTRARTHPPCFNDLTIPP